MEFKLKKINENEVTTFKKWWETYGNIYEKAGVDKESASSIWSAAVDSITGDLEKILTDPKFRL